MRDGVFERQAAGPAMGRPARSDAVPMSDEKVCVGIGMGEMATGYSFSRECIMRSGDGFGSGEG